MSEKIRMKDAEAMVHEMHRSARVMSKVGQTEIAEGNEGVADTLAAALAVVKAGKESTKAHWNYRTKTNPEHYRAFELALADEAVTLSAFILEDECPECGGSGFITSYKGKPNTPGLSDGYGSVNSLACPTCTPKEEDVSD